MKGKSEGDTRKPIIVANTRPSNHWGEGNVYSIDGISPTLTSGSTIKNGLKIMDNRKIKKVGNINPNKPHQSGDVYNIHGLSRTLSATDSKHPCYITEGNKVERIKDNRKIKLIKSYNGHQSGNIYDKNGLSPSLCCTDYKAPVKIVEDRGGNSMDKDIIDNNFTEVEKGKYITTDRERESCYAITTHPRSRPLHKKQDNYVLEECIGSTQKHAARTDGSCSPTLTCAMGQGGGHIPMLKLRETTKKGYKEADVGDGVATDRINCSVRRGVAHKESTGTLNTQDGSWGTVTNDYRIRKLTPVECERLQAFPDNWTKYGKDGEEISDTQRYKCMGNAVTTSVVTYVINKMFGVSDE